MKLLVAEDDPKLLKTLIHLLKINNYLVDGVDNGKDALDYALTNEYDGLIFDIMMPHKDGITVLKTLREKNINTPTLFLTAKTEVYQRVEGLDAGADDYISKPFTTAELLARIRAMLRRKDNFVPDVLNYNDVLLNRSTYELSYKDKVQPLSGKEFQVMEILMQKKSVITTIEQLIVHIWGWDSSVDISVVWVHISNIRKKIEILEAPLNIKFIRNAGYVLEEI